MRIYANLLEAAKEIERDLWELGAVVNTATMQDRREKQGFETRELVGYQFSVPAFLGKETPEDVDNFCKFMGLDTTIFVSYLYREARERSLGVANPGTAWEVRRDEWERYLHQGKFAYTYPERLHSPTDQFDHCERVLKADPHSRQAIVQIYDKHIDHYNTGGIARIPCSLSYQFIGRYSDGEFQLNCIYTMRSCDFYRHWAYDIKLASYATAGLAVALGWKIGRVIMQIGSLHAYREDLDKRKIF